MGLKMAVLTGMLLAVPVGAQTGAVGPTTAVCAGWFGFECDGEAVGGGAEEVVGLGGVRAV